MREMPLAFPHRTTLPVRAVQVTAVPWLRPGGNSGVQDAPRHGVEWHEGFQHRFYDAEHVMCIQCLRNFPLIMQYFCQTPAPSTTTTSASALMQEMSGPMLFGQCLGLQAPRQFAAEVEWLLCVLSCRSATLESSMKCNGGTQIEYIDFNVYSRDTGQNNISMTFVVVERISTTPIAEKTSFTCLQKRSLTSKPTVVMTVGQAFLRKVTTFLKPLSNGGTLDKCEGPGFELRRGHCVMRLYD